MSPLRNELIVSPAINEEQTVTYEWGLSSNEVLSSDYCGLSSVIIPPLRDTITILQEDAFPNELLSEDNKKDYNVITIDAAYGLTTESNYCGLS